MKTGIFSQKTLPTYFFVFIAFIVMSLGFYNNSFKVSERFDFQKFELYSESLIVGRLSMSHKEGIFAHGGLTGRITDIPKDKAKVVYKDLSAQTKRGIEILYQYEIYRDNINFNSSKYATYDTQTGGQAMLFSLIDKLFPTSKPHSISRFNLLTAMLTALAFSLFLFWIVKTYNLFTGAVVLILIVFSIWLTWFGNNLYWSLWGFYVPFLWLLFFLRKKSLANKKIKPLHLFMVVFISFFIKCFFTGFEYITTASIMTYVPLLYYGFEQQWNLKKLFKLSLVTVSGVITAVLTAMLILVSQIAAIKGTFSAGFEHIKYSLNKRTSGDASQFDDVYKNSLESSYAEVLGKYFNGTAFDFNVFYDSRWESLLRIDFGELFLIFAIFSALLYAFSKNKDFIMQARNAKLLIFITWFSILAPLSWFTIFKGHSYIHTHMNFIAWYMPFALFGFVIIGIVVSYIFNVVINLTIFKSVKAKWKPAYTYVLALLVTGLLLIPTLTGTTTEEKSIAEQLVELPALVDKEDYKIYIFDNNIWYIRDKNKQSTAKSEMFFLHLIPESISDLPQNRKKYKFDNLDFNPSKNEVKEGSNFYVLKKKLPSYKIKAIITGQYDKSGRLWQTDYFKPLSIKLEE